MKQYRWLSTAGLMAAVVVMGFACGDGEPAEAIDCGEGTKLEDGECVPDTDGCPDGQVLAPDGQCAADPGNFACDEGTSYDYETGQCVSDSEVVCGEGTIEDDGQCVLEDPRTCGEGTVLLDGECVAEQSVCGHGTGFDDDEIECHLTDEACQGTTMYDVGLGECVETVDVECGEGTVDVDNTCVSTDSVADELAADADIDHADGVPIEPSDDEQFIFTGVLDDTLSHTYDFYGEEGQWLEITLYSRGLPAPGFALSTIGGNWQRKTLAGMVGGAPSRTVLMPAEELYQFTVETSLTDDADWNGDGDESWAYVGTVDVVEAPTADTWEVFDESLGGRLDETKDNFVEIDVGETYEALLTMTTIGDDAGEPTLEVWSEPDEFSERLDLVVDEEFAIDVAEETTVYLHFDAVDFVGSDVNFEVVGRPTHILEPNDTYETEVDADAGDVVYMSHTSNEAEPMAVSVRHDDQQLYLFDDVLAANQSSFDHEESNRQFFYARDAGTYSIEYRNTSDDDVTAFQGTVEADGDTPVFEVPEEGGQSFDTFIDEQNLEEGDWRVVVLDTPAQSLFDVKAESGGGTPRMSVYDDETRTQIVDEWMSGNSTEFDFETDDGGVFYLVLRPSGFSTSDIQIDIVGQTIDPVAPGESYEATFDASVHDLLTGTAGFSVGEEADIRLLNPQGDILREETGVDASIDFFELLPGSGTFTIEIENTGSEAMPAAFIDVDVSSPFDSLSLGSQEPSVYERPQLEEGASEFLVFQHQNNDDLVATIGAELEDEEEVAIRLWDIDERQVVWESDEPGEPRSTHPLSGLDRYAVEVEALSEVTEYELTIEAFEIYFHDETKHYDPPLEIIADSDEDVTESSTMSVEECQTIIDLSVAVDLSQGSGWHIAIELESPDGDVFMLEDDTSLSPGGGFYPDDDEPVDSLDGLASTSAVGDWTLDVTNTSSGVDAALGEWTLHLTCAQ